MCGLVSNTCSCVPLGKSSRLGMVLSFVDFFTEGGRGEEHYAMLLHLHTRKLGEFLGHLFLPKKVAFEINVL